MKQLDIPWRVNFEAVSATAWTVALLMLVVFISNDLYPRAPMLVLLFLYAVLMGVNWYRANKLWFRKAALNGRPLSFISATKLKDWVSLNHGQLNLGRGFEWKREHCQHTYDLRKADEGLLKPPYFYSWAIGMTSKDEKRGSHWIHGIDPQEEDIVMPSSHREGNTVILGTSGSGKTVASTHILFQDVQHALEMGGCVIAIDPKGDQQIRRGLMKACELAGQPKRFRYFHPAFPQDSVRIDPLGSWNRSTEIAARIMDVMPTENASGDPFANFSWRAINIVVQGLELCGMKSTLSSIKEHIESGIDKLLEKALREYFKTHVENWQSRLKDYRGQKDSKYVQGSPELRAMVKFYNTEVRKLKPYEPINGMINLYDHDRAHFGKMITILLPVLEMLTSGHLGPMLSPTRANPEDKRDILTGKSIVECGYICYIGLDSLPDRTVSGAIGSILLADLASVAGDIYNYGDKTSNASEKKPIYLFADEINEIANMPFINILNKARGAGVITTAATQTLSDLIVRLGDEDKARMAMGNFNNLIAFRTIDGKTQELITEAFGTTMIHTVMHEQKTVAIGNDRDVTNYSGGYGERLMETPDNDLFPQELLGQLPDLEYVARISGGRVVKGRIPILQSNG